ncbi:MAG TPA: glycosyltransferase [Thermoleophilaceae bacterium]|nr:glycosyltransferase [Thermoleophilaceae bacterium]
MHILVLADRDWTHPQGGGSGANLREQALRWVAAGNRVTIVCCSYPGAVALERDGALTIHRVGGRSTVFPHAIWRQWRGLVPDADVVLEIVNGITFLTPLWLRTPRVVLVHHIHRRHYVEEMGRRRGKIAALLLETLPLRLLYRDARFLTVSEAAASEIAEHGVPAASIEVVRNGVDLAPADDPRSDGPTLLYLGRLKRYKRIELLLDALAQVPEARLEIAGDGEHRPELERAIARRDLGDRVRLHGHVDERGKQELLTSAWVNVTASSNEGWCLTVMEAAACGTPSVAIAEGGLRESIVHEQTGLLAEQPEQLGDAIARIVGDDELRARLGERARARADEFSWDRTAGASLAALEAEHAEGRLPARSLSDLARTDFGRAGGLAAAVIVSNVIALVFTVVFARLLGASGYGSLAALVSASIILMVPGSALQIAVAREISAAGPGGGAGVRHWISRIALGAVLIAVAAVMLRDVLGAVLNVDQVWAAAAVPVCAFLWMIVSVERGALQGYRRYRVVAGSIIGEAFARLAFGVVLVLAGLDVTGAFLATPLALVAIALVLARPLAQELPERRDRRPLLELLSGAWIPVIGLTLLFALQEVHVIVVKHEVSDELAGAYGVAAVAAKAIIWVAVGLGMYLLPEAARRSHEGIDPRPVLMRTLTLIALAALPMVALYAVAAEPLLRTVFGPDLTGAADALPWLGLAMALLACAYLSVQYLLALGRSSFIWVLAVAAALEIGLLAFVGANVTEVAIVLFGLQLFCAVSILTLSLRARPRETLVA